VTAAAAIFTCSICGEPAGEICVYCTKDACVNHRCDRCKRCSDCCECEIPLSAAEAQIAPEPIAPEQIAPEMDLPAQPEAHMPEAEAAAVNEPAPEPSENIQPPQTENPIF
jgi:hypothetical protein